MAVHPPFHPPRTYPMVPGLNANPMTHSASIGHTPWRVQAPRDRTTHEVVGKPLPAKRLDPRPTGGYCADKPRAATTRPSKGNAKSRNRNRAARAARARAANR